MKHKPLSNNKCLIWLNAALKLGWKLEGPYNASHNLFLLWDDRLDDPVEFEGQTLQAVINAAAEANPNP